MANISIAEQAARWYARLLAPDCSAADHAEFDAWLKDAEHARAYARARRLAESLASLAKGDERLSAMAGDALRMNDAEGPGDADDCTSRKAGGA